MSAQDALKTLYESVKEVGIIGSCAAVLGWDERTYMPKGGQENRANQLAYLSGLAHEKFTNEKIGELLKEIEASGQIKDEFSDDGANIREIRNEYDKAVKVPKKLVEEITHTSTMAQGVWGEARENSDFPKFLPYLEKLVKLKRELAECYGYEKEAYDALLDDYEPGATYESIGKVFEAFRSELVDLVAKIADSKKRPDMSIIEQEYAVDRQKIFGESAAAAIGYDFGIGRLDETTHPFCTGIGPGDTRITTRFNPKHLGQAFFGIMHEAGHGIYEQGLPTEHHGLPMGDAVSLGIHESQSRMWENLVGRSQPFWKHFFPRAQQMFPLALGNVKFDDFLFAINDVRPSLIRIEADEVTYNLHILLRFEIEHAFFKGDLEPKDVPAVWNENFKKYLGIEPPDDARGCLQDIHWSWGMIGYFPTYTLGNLYSAQFYAKAKEDIPDLESQFEIGNFAPMKGWLRKHIHIHGRRYRAEKLVEVATGKPLSHKPMMDYMRTKYGELYGF